jgi:hypothetical protein
MKIKADFEIYNEAEITQVMNYNLFTFFNQHLLQTIEDEKANKPDNQKLRFILLLGHDTNLVYLLSAFGNGNIVIEYASNFIFELYKKQEAFSKLKQDLRQSDYYVVVAYNGENVPGFEKIGLEQFSKFLQEDLFKDYEDFLKKCNLDEKDSQNESSYFWIAFVLVFMLILGLLGLAMAYHIKRKKMIQNESTFDDSPVNKSEKVDYENIKPEEE